MTRGAIFGLMHCSESHTGRCDGDCGLSSEPVKNAVPGPFGPGEKAPFFLFRILPPGETVAAAPKSHNLASRADWDDRFNGSASKSIKLTNNGLSLGLPNIRFESLTQIGGERSISDEAAEVIGQLIIKNRFQSGRRR